MQYQHLHYVGPVAFHSFVEEGVPALRADREIVENIFLIMESISQLVQVSFAADTAHLGKQMLVNVWMLKHRRGSHFASRNTPST